MSDNVNKPSHYTSGDVECIDGIRAALGENFADYCRGNVLKYVWRCGKKGDAIEDLRKAAKYLQWAIEAMESEKKPETLAIPEGWRELEENEPLCENDLFEFGGEWVGHEYDSTGGVYSSRIHRRHIRKIETEKPAEATTEWTPKVGDKVQVVGGFMNPIGEVGFIEEFCAAVAGNFTISTNGGSCTLGWFSKDDVKLIEAAQ